MPSSPTGHDGREGEGGGLFLQSAHRQANKSTRGNIRAECLGLFVRGWKVYWMLGVEGGCGMLERVHWMEEGSGSDLE